MSELVESQVTGNSRGNSQSSGTLPQRARRARARQPWIKPRLEALHAGLLADKGGETVVSTAQGVLMEIAVDAYAVCLFLVHNIETRGAVRRDGTLRPAVLSLATYQNTLRLHLQALGLERLARDANLDLRTLWERQDGAPLASGDGNAESDGQGPAQAMKRTAEEKPRGQRQSRGSSKATGVQTAAERRAGKRRGGGRS